MIRHCKASELDVIASSVLFLADSRNGIAAKSSLRFNVICVLFDLAV